MSHDNPIGMYGIAKTIVGYLASSIGGRIDTEHPLSRFALVFFFFHFHQAILGVTHRVLLNHSAPLLQAESAAGFRGHRRFCGAAVCIAGPPAQTFLIQFPAIPCRYFSRNDSEWLGLLRAAYRGSCHD